MRGGYNRSQIGKRNGHGSVSRGSANSACQAFGLPPLEAPQWRPRC